MTFREIKTESLPVVQYVRFCGEKNGLFAGLTASGEALDESCWEDVVCSQLPALLDNPVKVLKSDGNNTVIMGHLGFGEAEMGVVVKVYGVQDGFLGRIRGLLRCKAVRNFKASVRLLEHGIRVAYPLAAIKKGGAVWSQEGVFVTEYADGAADLHDFVLENIRLDGKGSDYKMKRDLAEQIGGIFAKLDGGGLWHRDSKAGNFLVCPRKGEGVDVVLVDLDGIKRKLVKRRQAGFRGLAKLASTLIWHGGISRSDYLRAFTVYSNLTGLGKGRRRKVFRRLARRAVGLRLLMLAKAAINQKSKIKNQN